MPDDIFSPDLFDPDPFVIDAEAGAVTGTGAGSQDASTSASSGLVRFLGIAVGSQDASGSAGDGLLLLLGTGTGATAGYSGSGTGTVTAGATPAVTPAATAGAGGGGGRAKKPKKLFRPWSLDPPKKIRPLPKLPEEPQIVLFGTGAGTQPKQIGSGAGRIGYAGRAWAWQLLSRAEGRGLVLISGNGKGRQDAEMRAIKRRMEEEWLLMRFLEAA